MNDFGPSRLDCKVILSKGYLRLTGVSILRYKIAGIASQHDVIYLTLSARTKCNHFADVSKMVSYRLSGIVGRLLCLFNNSEIAIMRDNNLQNALYKQHFLSKMLSRQSTFCEKCSPDRAFLTMTALQNR